ncbi:MAG: efflux RND transporter periplasmic adaptor subunit [Myxococcales bacterium FL481]|nr:MAG: efflux RND transporter periplasmic adaptor subunit [Myxococcales bacterium FL481]
MEHEPVSRAHGMSPWKRVPAPGRSYLGHASAAPCELLRYASRALMAARFAVLLFTLACACGQARSEAAPPGKPADRPALVRVRPVEEGKLTDRWTYVGQVQPLMEARLGAGVGGEVKEVNVRVGDRVARGKQLVRVDSRLARARMEAARADRAMSQKELAQAERDLRRTEALGQSIVPEAELEQSTTRAQTLTSRAESFRAAVREARERLRLHRVDAPFEGTVSARHVDPGDWVQPGDPVLDLVAEDRVEVLANAAPELAPHVDVGSEAMLRHERGSVPARVLGVVRALDPTTRTIKVRLVPDAPQPWLLVGESVEAEFPVERRGPGVVVPRDALVSGAINTRVIEVVDDTARSVVVEVLATAGDRALVTGEGLAIGNERLRPGQSVTLDAESG